MDSSCLRPPRLTTALAVIVCLSAQALALNAPGDNPAPTSTYRMEVMSGFTVLVSPDAVARPETEQALNLLRRKLDEIAQLVRRDRLAVLRRARIWVEWEARPDGAAEFHPSAQWLRENGYNADKAGCVEISNLRHFVAWCNNEQPMMILHELAHAYEHYAPADVAKAIHDAYDHAAKVGRYESVGYVHGGKKRAYALNNPKEYFAEMTECYFGRNDFEPFTRDELMAFDPAGYRLMERVWGAPVSADRSPAGTPSPASSPPMGRYRQPKFCNLIFANTELELVGLRRFLDGARERGLADRFRITLLLHPDAASADRPGHRAFYRKLYDEGHEIGVFYSGGRPALARWLGIPEKAITTIGFQLFGDVDVEEQARASAAGFLAGSNACIEGDSMKEELWDIPHNWEGAPYMPYWVQWDLERPEATSRVGREMTKREAVLELQWATRTMWHSYDRICLPMCFHFGEPVKHSQWPFEQMAHRGDIWWWRAEIDELEANLQAGRTPLLYLNTGSEANVFTPGGPWSPMLDNDEALECALELVELLVERDWNLITVREFAEHFRAKWPCPSAPSAAFLMRDTLTGRRDKKGLVIPSHGRLLHAETRHYQIVDHENRIAPELVVAYDLATPNLLRGGYTFGDPALHGAGQNPGQYSATSGNAVFWSPSPPLANADGEPYYHSNKPADARNRIFTLYPGDEWEPYQFSGGKLSDVRRTGDEVRWTKEMTEPVAGSDIRVRYTHRLVGPEHRVRVDLLGSGADGKPVRLRLCPYFHQGWDTDHRKPGPEGAAAIPDPKTVGQERNVFGRAAGREVAYSETNAQRTVTRIQLPRGKAAIDLFNRNPGRAHDAPGWTIDDNPDMNRGMTVTVEVPDGASVAFVDEPGPGHYVTAIVELGAHRPGRAYTFAFRYWHGLPR